jgi:hypothetical protein
MKITINGKEHQHDKCDITYDEIVEYVYGKDCKTLVSIAYHWKGHGDIERQGIISPEQSVEIVDNMRFSAYYTGNA